MSDYLTADAILAARPHGWPALLRTFAKPINPALIKNKPGRGNPEYVPHHTLRQYLHLAFDYTTIRTLDVVDKGDGKYGLRCELTCALGGDVRTFHGWGESDNTDYPLKSAESDAFRRICGMDLGLGLSLWARETSFLASAYEASEMSSPSAPPTDVAEEVTGSPVAGESAPPRADSPSPSSEEDTVEEVLPKADRARMRSAFMARIKGLGLDYDGQVKPWLVEKYGGGWSDLSDEAAAKLYHGLIVPSGSREEKDAAGDRFKKAVTA